MSQALQGRERQLGNLQKEIITNYFLQKYSSLMSEMTHNSQDNYQSNFQSKPRSPSKKVNFKNLLKKQHTNNHLPSRVQMGSRVSEPIEPLSPSRAKKEEEQASRNIKKLEASLIRELFKESPTKLESRQYTKVEIRPVEMADKSVQNIERGYIEITLDEREGDSSCFENQEESSQAAAVREAIKRQFSLRKERPVRLKSPQQSSLSRREESEVKSSQISEEGRIQSPKKLNTASPFGKGYISPGKHSRFHDEHSQRRSSSIQPQDPGVDSSSPQVHFSKEIQPIEHSKQFIHQDEIIQKDIQFMAPSSTYYRSQNSNFVEEAFKFQSVSNRDKDSHTSERESCDKNEVISQSLNKVNSKTSLKERERPHSNSSGKDSSRLEMSFVSKMSYISGEGGQNIKLMIEQELFQNELGPYQSALYGVLELIEKYPRSGPVYAVGQRTLEDRKQVEERKKSQMDEAEQLKRKIQRLERRSMMWTMGGEDDTIRNNKLKISRLIRQLATKHTQRQ